MSFLEQDDQATLFFKRSASTQVEARDLQQKFFYVHWLGGLRL